MIGRRFVSLGCPNKSDSSPLRKLRSIIYGHQTCPRTHGCPRQATQGNDRRLTIDGEDQGTRIVIHAHLYINDSF